MKNVIEQKRRYYMNQENLIRLAFIFSDNNKKNFNENLKLLILFILNENTKELTAFEIAEKIKEKTGIEFTEEEINKSINFDNGKYVCFNKKNIETETQGRTITQSITQYYISDNGREKINDKNKLKFQKILEEFIRENKLEENIVSTEDLLFKYIYGIINFNIDELISLCNVENTNTSTNNFREMKFTNQEKDLINKFLTWNNKKKNDYLLRLIIFSVDYCMLTIKRNAENFKQVFKGKTFYLDSNIIFRLVGINKEERKIATENFINTCKNAGVVLKVTGATLTEIDTSIDSHMTKLKKQYQGIGNIKDETILRYNEAFENIDDYFSLYYKWRSLDNKHNSIESFKFWLKTKVYECLQTFSIDRKTGDITSNKADLITQYMSDLAKIKYNSISEYNENVLKTDCVNYLYLSSLRNNENGYNYLNINNYFITADNNLVYFDKQKREGEIPLITLPSVWQTLLLKLNGRTEDDYNSFVEFITLRKNTDIDEAKLQSKIIECIGTLNVINEIKEQTLVQVTDEIIKNGLKSFTINNEYSEQATIKYINKCVEIATDERDKRIIQEASGYIKKEHAETLLLQKAEKSAKKAIRIYNGISCCLKYVKIICLLIFLSFVLWIVLHNRMAKFSDITIPLIRVNYSSFSLIVSIILSIFGAFLSIIRKKFFCEGNEEELIKKYYQKYKSDFL